MTSGSNHEGRPTACIFSDWSRKNVSTVTLRSRLVYCDLPSHQTIRDHNAPAIVGLQKCVSKRQSFHNGGDRSSRQCHLQTIANVERPVQQQRDAGDEVPQRVLGSEAEHDRGDACTG